jgi:hypothetical protein
MARRIGREPGSLSFAGLPSGLAQLHSILRHRNKQTLNPIGPGGQQITAIDRQGFDFIGK